MQPEQVSEPEQYVGRRKFSLTRTVAAPVAVMLAPVALLSASYYSYSNLTDETLIAELSFEQLAEHRYLVNLSTGNFCDVEAFEIEGDQWRLDARFLKWKNWATAMGAESQYRLDRIEGRFSDVEMQNAEQGLSYDLSGETAIDVVDMSATLGRLNVLADASYGSSTFQVIDPDSIYDVYKTPTGIITRKREDPGFAFEGDVLTIDINNACGAKPGPWKSFSLWVNEQALNLKQ